MKINTQKHSVFPAPDTHKQRETGWGWGWGGGGGGRLSETVIPVRTIIMLVT